MKEQCLAFKIFFDSDFIKLSVRLNKDFKSEWVNQNKITSLRLYQVFRVLNEYFTQYVNDFITLDYFASYHGVNVHKMKLFLKIGRFYNHYQTII